MPQFFISFAAINIKANVTQKYFFIAPDTLTTRLCILVTGF